MCAVSGLTYLAAKREIRKDRQNLLKGVSNEIERDFQHKMSHIAQDTRHLANILDTHVVSAQTNWSDLHLRELLNVTSYDYVFVVRAHDNVIIASSDTDNSGRKFGGSRPKSLTEIMPGQNSWTKATMAVGDVKVLGWQENAYVSGLYHRVAGSNIDDPVVTHYIAMVSPVSASDGSANLLLVIVANWKIFQDGLDAANHLLPNAGFQTGYAFLFGPDSDTIIGHQERSLLGKKLTHVAAEHKEYKLDNLMMAAKNASTTSLPVSYEYRGLKTASVKSMSWAPVTSTPTDEELGSKADSLPVNAEEALNWKLGVGIKDEELLAFLYERKLYFLIIPLVVALLVLAFSLYGAAPIKYSLMELAQFARDAAGGKISVLAEAKTDDEIGQLAQACNLLVVSLRERVAFNRIPNPYIVGNPLQGPGMFFGREEDLAWVGKQIESKGNKLIGLFGQRRIGKTSLLQQILHRRATNNSIPFFVDVQAMVPRVKNDSDFYHVLTSDVLEQLPKMLPQVGTPFIMADRFTPDNFCGLLQFLNKAAPSKTPVILLDELENIEDKLAKGVLSTDILCFLGGLLDGQLNISFVATGSSQAIMIAQRWAAIGPKIISRKIGLLSHNEALKLVTEPLMGYVVFDPIVPERVLRLTGGHPFYTQVMCQLLVDQLNYKQESIAGLPQLNETIKLCLNNPPPPLAYVWSTTFTPMQQAACAALAHQLTDEEDFRNAEDLIVELPNEVRQLFANNAGLHGALENLVENDWLERGDAGDYRFRVDLLRLWIKREHSIWHLAEELQGGAVA
jgi:HAMP domain-containing protein